MKTTIELSEPLLIAAKQAAREDGTTLRALIERALRSELGQRGCAERFQLREASFGGSGLQAEFAGATWEQLRAAAYEGRGA